MISNTDSTQELDEILSDWEFEVFGTPKHWDKTTDRLELDAKRNQAILDWHNKQVEQAYSDGFQKASKGALKSQQEAKREAVEAVLDRLVKHFDGLRVEHYDVNIYLELVVEQIEAERNKLLEAEL